MPATQEAYMEMLIHGTQSDDTGWQSIGVMEGHDYVVVAIDKAGRTLAIIPCKAIGDNNAVAIILDAYAERGEVGEGLESIELRVHEMDGKVSRSWTVKRDSGADFFLAGLVASGEVFTTQCPARELSPALCWIEGELAAEFV